MGQRRIKAEERFVGPRLTLRLVTVADCTPKYVEWLEDPEVNRYLETRWAPQTLASVTSFVVAMAESADSYLFAMVDNSTQSHIGNIKIGPVQPKHSYADISYFIGDRTMWGKGLATEAIRQAARLGFERLGLNRVQAGLYGGNIGSARALEKAGFALEGRFKKQLRVGDVWEDHVWYGLVREDWLP